MHSALRVVFVFVAAADAQAAKEPGATDSDRDEEYARFLEAFTSDATDAVVDAVVSAKFPDTTDEECFLRVHFEKGVVKAMEQEYASALASFADAKSLLPEGSELLDLFW